MTCAETTIWSLIEYFGNKYPEYQPVLLSQITKLLQKYSFKRLLPSEGLTAEQITFALREFGFGSMIYSQEKLSKAKVNIDVIISTYIESGIPIVGVLKNKEIGHVVNIVGREKENREETVICQPHEILPNGLPVIDFNKITRNYVFIDDNYPPFQVTKLDKPCEIYYKSEKWHSCEIKNVIVPLYKKIYLDAARATRNFYKALEIKEIGIVGTEPRILKIFLASSRSYKSYIALNEDLNPVVKELVLALSMPKFIWIAELSKKESYIAGKCDEFYIQDATEPVEFIDMDVSTDTSLISAFSDGTFFVQNLGNFKGLNIFDKSPFDSYKENLK
ncbi:hypothetical protein [Mucilaginibacter terrae]|uniref:Peptidase C39 domain-containing protein n=1 Tax=Mucilaginibacter terrae TaxID=1955052 RepID=A0ABU3GWY8_9SPHI|nr:hypothetical protein [Mucilaginibacter terrae]MDT3404268.1 hypothetical protein [Mucilaginibacter terrae]